MVAKKKNAPEGETPKSSWASKPAKQEEIEFDPSRVASPGLRASAVDDGTNTGVAETHDAEGWEQPFRDGHPDSAPSAPVGETADAAAPADTAPKGKAKGGKKSPPVEEAPTNKSNGELISIVERIERLLEEVAGYRDDIKEIYGEAKGTGFDTATIRRAIAYRQKDPKKLQEQQDLLDTYLHALGMI